MSALDPRLGAIALFLVGILAAAVLLLAADRRQRALAARIAAVIGGHAGRAALPSPARPAARLRTPMPHPFGAGAIARLLALDPAATGQHPLPWRAVLMAASVLGLLAGWQGFSIFGPAGLLAAPLIAAGLPRAVFAHGRRRYRERLHAQIPDVLAMVVRAVRAGVPVVEAVRGIAREMPTPTREEFSTLSAQVQVGMPLDAALWSLVRRSGVPEYAFFAVALTLQAQTGGSLAETLDNLAEIVRKRIAIRARGLALAAEARMSAAVLTGVPVCTGIGLAILNPSYMSVLFEDPRGQRVLAAAAGMLLAGTLVIRMLIRRTLA